MYNSHFLLQFYRDQDFQDALAVFKLILRWSNDSQLTGAREKALADYIVHKGLASRGLRDEILVQLCNQAWKNDNPEKVWQLMAHCLAAFQPGPALSKLVFWNVTMDIFNLKFYCMSEYFSS